MCNRYDSERAAEAEMLKGYIVFEGEGLFVAEPEDDRLGVGIAEIEETRLGAAHREVAAAKAEIDVDTWEQEGGAL